MLPSQLTLRRLGVPDDHRFMITEKRMQDRSGDPVHEDQVRQRPAVALLAARWFSLSPLSLKVSCNLPVLIEDVYGPSVPCLDRLYYGDELNMRLPFS